MKLKAELSEIAANLTVTAGAVASGNITQALAALKSPYLTGMNISEAVKEAVKGYLSEFIH